MVSNAYLAALATFLEPYGKSFKGPKFACFEPFSSFPSILYIERLQNDSKQANFGPLKLFPYGSKNVAKAVRYALLTIFANVYNYFSI